MRKPAAYKRIISKAAALKWLNGKLQKYGNTMWFPTKDKIKLNSLIEQYGNTYFWK